MSVEEWIGSLISLLALAALFFLNQRKVQRDVKQVRGIQEEDHEVEGEDEEDDVWMQFLKQASETQKPSQPLQSVQSVKKIVKPLQKSAKAVQPPRIHFDEEARDLNVQRTELKSSSLLELKRLPSVHDAFEMNSRAKKIVGGLPSLRTMIICREILEKPKG